MRLLYRVVDDALFARALNRRDFVRVSDGMLWAHESHEWLVAAESGVVLAHRTRDIYYDPDSGLALYYEVSEPLPALSVVVSEEAPGSQSRENRRTLPL
jgi:hypothetical protein